MDPPIATINKGSNVGRGGMSEEDRDFQHFAQHFGGDSDAAVSPDSARDGYYSLVDFSIVAVAWV